MSPLAAISPPVLPLVLSTGSARFTPAAQIPLMTAGGVAFGSATWPSAGRALYVPFSIPWAYPIARVFWSNGSAVAGNVDLGIYTADGAGLFSVGAIAQAGTNAFQYTTVNWLLGPGSYYLALAAASASAAFFRFAPSAITLRHAGLLQQASAEPLPSSMTPASIASAYYPLFGLTRTTSGF